MKLLREAMPADAPAVLHLSKEAHRLSFYSQIPLAIEKVKFLIARCIIKDDCFSYVAEHDGKITGVLFGEVVESPTLRGMAFQDHIFYVNCPGAGPALLTVARVWAQTQGAVILGITVSFGGENIDRVGKLLEHKGLTHCGGVYLQLLE